MKDVSKRLLDFKISQVKIKVYLLLCFTCVLGYWPISLNLFSLKNDATMYFLPYRYQISNAIQNGEFPFWSPYLYMGFPIHGDMQSGAWNPIVWVISLFTTYNMSVLHFESLLYIFIAGIGMYKLLNEFRIDNRIKSAIAISYMFSGFVTDSGQFIVWLACAAFIPFVFLYFYRLLYRPVYLNAFKTALALCMLLWAGYPSFLIYCCYILLAAFIVRVTGLVKDRNILVLKSFLAGQAIFIALFLLISLPALLSFAELLPYYARGTSVTLHDALIDPLTIKCTTSFLIPFNLSREDIGFGTDPTMRNTYAGIFSVIFFIPAISGKMRPILKFVLFVLVLIFLFTLGATTPVREISYRFVPLMNYFRHPANMRLFSSLCILFIAAFGLQKVFENHAERSGKRIMNLCILVAAAIIVIIFYFWADAGWSFKIKSLAGNGSGTDRNYLKQLFYDLSFPFAILLVGTVQLVFLFSAIALRKKRAFYQYLLALIIVNALVIGQFSLPSTFVSKISPEAINSFIKKYPAGFPVNELKAPVKEDASQDSVYDPIVYGYASYYNKKIEIPRRVTTPCILASTDSFLHSSEEKKLVSGHPVFYLEDSALSGTNTIAIDKFGSNSFSLSTKTEKTCRLNISQNYFKHWQAAIDGHSSPIILSNTGFMSILVPAGIHLIHFEYAPYNIYIAMIISLTAFVISCCYFLLTRLKKADGKK